MSPDARVPPAPPDLRQRVSIETPEHVRVHLDLAGLGSRTAAALVDLLLVQLILAATMAALLLLVLRGRGPFVGWTAALLIVVGSFTLLAYFALFEGLWGGRTPGKRLIGIRVVMDSGRPVTPTAVVVRTLMRLVDSFFPLAPFLPGLIAVVAHPHNKRLGDLAAGTLVVRDRPTEWGLAAVPEPAEEPLETGPPMLDDAEFRLLDRFLARLADLDTTVTQPLAEDLARRFEGRVPRGSEAPVAYLVAVLGDEQARRRGRFGTRARVGAVGRTTVAAERFVARKRSGWEEFYELARRVERTGLGTLHAAQIPGFAARYREVAADLARAHTYGVDAAVIEHLERLVTAGHNTLYGMRQRRPRVGALLLRTFPAAVVRSWRYVLAAWALFAAPAAVGYALLREDPGLADTVVSPVMVSRAEQAAARQADGVGYAEAAAAERPALAALLISNNVLVCFYVFAGGLLAGTWTVTVLILNGLSLGMACGLFANYDALGYLLTFVAGHGVLELTAIFISAGAGLRIARALVAPGDFRRRDALVHEGRVAAEMIAVVVSLLIVAGAIEGLLSASDAPAPLKLGVSAASLLLLGLYLGNGWRVWRAQERPVGEPA